MILIFGGAYQGKLEYAFSEYGVSDSVFHCSETSIGIDFSKRIINSFHLAILAYIKHEKDPLEFVMGNLGQFKNKIIICDDISGGVVPISKEMRLWREAAGKCISALANNSNEVIRVFCGIGMKIK